MRKIKFTITILLITFLLFYFGPLLQWVTEPLIVSDQLQKADLIVILSDGANQNGQLSPNTLERMDYGLEIFQKGYVKHLLLAGVNSPTVQDANLMYDYALKKGFPADFFILDQISTSISENVLFTSKIATTKHYQSIILVTSPYNSVRAKKMFAAKNLNIISAPVKNSVLYAAKGQNKIRVAQNVGQEYLQYGLYQLSEILKSGLKMAEKNFLGRLLSNS